MKQALLLFALLLAACQQLENESGAEPNQLAGPPSLAELGHVTYLGIEDVPVKLVNGEWQGDPYDEGGFARPRAGLAGYFSLRGDVDGDGNDETVVLLWTSSGGSGTFDYIAVVDRDQDGKLVNTGTAPLGDRVKVRSASIVDGHIVLDVVQAGPDDAMCCPGQKVRRIFALADSTLSEIASVDMGRVSPDPLSN